ncbi:MAG: hypothetical protein VYA27_13185, partial [Verrucomicrobiota bacterium]|nr:hypothetical protein [Verrucomicrobiota bacterium]
MKSILTSLSILAGGATIAGAATIIGEGAARPFTGGTPDGWSGVTVLETAVIDSNTEGGLVEITEVSMFAGGGRAGGSHHLQAILVDSNNLITWISPELTPTQEGLNVFPITGAGTIDATGGPLRLGLWQWNDGQDDNAGGTVAFAGGGGGGMFQQNLNGSLGADAISIGHDTGGGQQHASGAGGRDYHIDVVASPVGATTDGDGDGLPDSWETANNLDPDDNGEDPNNNGLAGDPDQGAAGDPDNDNLTNFEEFELGTDPQVDDTDMDGLLDGVESNTGTWNGADDTGTDPNNADSDDDGLSDGLENPDLAHNPLDPSQQPGTNPNLADTDGDGKDDGAEIADGTDPTDENDGGLVAAESVLIGDGADRPFTGGTPDGWSGISILETAIIDSDSVPGVGDLVEITEVSIQAQRFGGTNH